MNAATPEQVVERALSVPERAKEIVIQDSQSFERAGGILTAIKALRGEINEAFDPIIKKAYAAHKEAVAQKKRAEVPLVEAEKYLKPQIAKYIAEQERIQRAEEERLRYEAAKQAEEEQLQAALAAEEAGDRAEAAAIIEDDNPLPPIILSDPTPKLEGVSVRKLWKFRIVDVNKIPRQYMLPDEKAIGAVVRGLRDKANIPGIEVYAVDSVAAEAK